MDIDKVVDLATGPGGALVIVLIFLVGLYRLSRDFIIPMMKASVDRHLDQVDKMMSMHSDEHRAIMDVLTSIHGRVEKCRYQEGK